MAEIRPFRAVRYNQEAIGDLSLVVAPPYDVIGDEERDHYHNRHPYNVIRLILNRPKKTDSDVEQPYVRSAEFFERWLAQRILVQDKAPGFYLYRQRYMLESRYRECTGLIARVRVEDFAEGVILPHEDIMPKPLEDRMRLLERTKANLDLVHTLYSDPDEKLKKPIMAEMDRFPLAQFQTEDGVAHDLWQVTEEGFARKMMRFFEKKPLYIADGHHRYQTAFEYSRRLKESGEEAGPDDPRHFLMMMIVEMENPGLSVLPVHRVVVAGEGRDAGRLLEGLREWFTVAEVEVPRGSRSGQVYHLMRDLVDKGLSGKAFGLFLPGPDRFYLLTWRQELDPDRVIEGDLSNSYKNLDVTVLHKLVIERLLGIPPDMRSVEENLIFSRDPLEAVRLADSGRGAFVFLMNPTKVEQVRDIADHGEKMPQKSTYFHPKPCSGVLMNRIDQM